MTHCGSLGLTELLLIEVVCEQDAGETLDVLVSWCLRTNIAELRRDGRVSHVHPFLVLTIFRNWRRLRE